MPMSTRCAVLTLIILLLGCGVALTEPDTASVTEAIIAFRKASRERDWQTWWSSLSRDAQRTARERILKDLEVARDGNAIIRECLAGAIRVRPSQVGRLSATRYLERWFESIRDPDRTPYARDHRSLEVKEPGPTGGTDVVLKFESGPDERFALRNEDGKWRISSPVFLASDTDLLETPESALTRLKLATAGASWKRVWPLYTYELRKTFLDNRVVKLKEQFPFKSFWDHALGILRFDELGSALFGGGVEQSRAARASLEKLGSSCVRVELDDAGDARVLDAGGKVVIHLVLEVSQWRIASDYDGILRDLGTK